MASEGVTTTERGPLSWQQAGRLRRDEARGERVENLATLFTLPPGTTAGTLRDRLATLMREQEVLTITELSLADGGYAVYSSDAEPPVSVHEATTLDELRALTASLGRPPFARAGGLPWRAAMIDHPDRGGRRTRSAWAIFDHVVGDGRSLHLFRAAVGGGDEPGPGRYREWVRWQLDRYPSDASEGPTGARAFWRRYLDGAAPDRSPLLPFCRDPGGPLSGEVRTVLFEVPLPPGALAGAAAAHRTSPFGVYLGAVASAVAAASGAEDVIVRVNTSGRPPEWLGTLGWLADSVPVRVNDPALADPRVAVGAASRAWLQAMRFETTPWDYVLASCAGGEPDLGARRPPLVDVNFLPYGGRGGPSGAANFATEKGQLAGLHLTAIAGDGAAIPFVGRFDPRRFDTDGVVAFLEDCARRLEALSGAP